MKYSFIKYSLMLFIVSHFNLSLANPSQIINEATSTYSTSATKTNIQAYNNSFTFDWNHYQSIAPNKNNIHRIETFLATLPPSEDLTPTERQALGKLLYKLGTFYTHVNRQPALAIDKLDQADKLLTTNKEKAWVYNHLAYAYELNYAASGNIADKEKAIDYIDRVIAKLYPNQQNKEVAFAFCVKGLVLNDAHDYKLAESSFKKALHIYEGIPGGRDDQYVRAKNRLADIILDQNERDKEAITLLKDLKSYWLTKKNVNQDPYAARNFLSLGKAYLKVGQYREASTEINNAIHIYKNIYGVNSTLLAKPYQLLSEVYKKMGNRKQAAFYLQKSQIFR